MAQTLQDSEIRYRRLFETAQDGILLLDAATGMIDDVNPYLMNMLGYTHEELLEKKLWQVGAFQDIFASQTAFEALQKNEYIRYEDLPLKTKDGQLVQVEFISNVYLVGNEKVIQCNIRDITDRKHVEEKLRSASAFLQSVQDAIPANIAILDDEGTIVQVNKAWRDFGVENGLMYADDCIGKNYLSICDETIGPDAAQAALIAHAIRDVRDGIKHEMRLEYPCHAPNQQRWFIVQITSFENNGCKWLVVAHTNITERKLIEAEIQQRLSQLEVLYQSGLAFSNLLNPKDIAQKMIDLLDQKMNWHHTAIRLYHHENQTLELLAFHLPHPTGSLEERPVARERLQSLQRPDQGVSGWVLRNGKVVRSNDLKNDPRYYEIFPGLQSGLYVPIRIGERILGVISIESERAHAFYKSDEQLVVTLAAQAAIAIQNAQLFESLEHSNHDLVAAYDATIEGWSRALDLRDKETEGHSLRVTEMALKLATALGLSEDELTQIRWGALLHDIGKMGVPDDILLKPGLLAPDEWITMKKHPMLAYEMLYPIHYLRQSLDIPRYHHERWDGTGYPHGLKGTEIPLQARIFAVVDVWDALRSDRPYRVGWPAERVREHIRFSSGTHFDPAIVDAFMKTFG